MYNEQEEKDVKEYLADQLARRAAGAPEHIRQLLNQMKEHEALRWWDEHGDKVRVQETPLTDLEKKVASLTPDDVTMAKRAGISLEEYAKNKLWPGE